MQHWDVNCIDTMLRASCAVIELADMHMADRKHNNYPTINNQQQKIETKDNPRQNNRLDHVYCYHGNKKVQTNPVTEIVLVIELVRN